MARTQTQYQHLTPSQHPRRQQLYMKGRNQTVGQLVAIIQAENWTPDEAAEDFHLPIEAIGEAIDYYHRYRDLIEAEVAEERRQLETRGYRLEAESLSR